MATKFAPNDEARVKATLTRVTILSVSADYALVRTLLGFQQAYRLDELEPAPADVCLLPTTA